MSRQDGSLNALRAAATAASTSAALAAKTEVISDSSLLGIRDRLEGREGEVRWINGADLLAVAAFHPLVVDEETRGLGVFRAIGSRELNMEI
jgi:hypothetical protein